MKRQIYAFKIEFQALNFKLRFLLLLLFFFVLESNAQNPFFKASELSQTWVYYYPEHWPEAWWEKDAQRMRETGILFVRIGEFAWSRYEPKRGQFDWGWLDRAMDVLGNAGLKIVLGTPTCAPPN